MLLTLASVAGCAAGAPRAAAPAAAPRARAQAPAAADRAAPGRGPFTRADVEALLAEGLGAFLARVDVAPVLDRGRFVGFRLDSALDLEAWRAAGVDIRLGDVIVRVNGIRVVRPEQAMWAFERLRIVREIEVVVLRADALVTLRHPIVDAAAQAARE